MLVAKKIGCMLIFALRFVKWCNIYFKIYDFLTYTPLKTCKQHHFKHAQNRSVF